MTDDAPIKIRTRVSGPFDEYTIEIRVEGFMHRDLCKGDPLCYPEAGVSDLRIYLERIAGMLPSAGMDRDRQRLPGDIVRIKRTGRGDDHDE